MKIMQKACTAIEKNLKKLKEAHLDLLQHDNLRDALDALLEDKLGLHYSQEKLNEVYNLGKERYKQEIPPGYGDKNKEGTKKYGDLILWFQIIDKAKEANMPIILVTDDRKEDWWTRLRGKIIGPRPELVNEMLSEAGVSFYLYQTDPFMESAKKFLKKQVKKKAIDEVREIRERDEELERGMKNAEMATFELLDKLRAISDITSSIKLSGALSKMDNLASSIKLPNDALISLGDLASSIKLPNISLKDLALSSKLPINIISATQAAKYPLPELNKYLEKGEDDKFPENIELKENNKNEKDSQKEK